MFYSWRYSKYRPDTKLLLKQSRKDNSKFMKTRVVIHVHETHNDLFCITVKYHNNTLFKIVSWSKCYFPIDIAVIYVQFSILLIRSPVAKTFSSFFALMSLQLFAFQNSQWIVGKGILIWYFRPNILLSKNLKKYGSVFLMFQTWT